MKILMFKVAFSDWTPVLTKNFRASPIPVFVVISDQIDSEKFIEKYIKLNNLQNSEISFKFVPVSM